MQDHKDPQAFTIVERYAHESSQKYVAPLDLISEIRSLTFLKVSPGESRKYSQLEPLSWSSQTLTRPSLRHKYWKTFDPCKRTSEQEHHILGIC